MPFVPVIADIRFNETGEIREFHTEEPQEDGQPFPNVFQWQENNYSCDCNRKAFFGHGPAEGNYCIGDGKYSVRLRLVSTGEIYYDEIREPVKPVPPTESTPDRFNRDI